jgi:cell division protein FtsW
VIVQREYNLTRNYNMLFGAVCCLILIGFIFIYSSSSVYALEYAHDAAYFIKKQVVGLGLGVLGACVFALIPVRLIYYLSSLFFLGSLSLTFFTLIPSLAYRIHGSSRWLNLGGFIFQPSELLKWSLIIFVAFLLSRKEDFIKKPLKRYLPVLCVFGIAALVLLKQPDFGLTVTLGATVVCLLFIAYPDWNYVVWLSLSAVPLIGLLIYFEPYRLRRILTFLDPWRDPQGAGFQVIQSLIAIGSGGLFGIGVSCSRQKFFYLPMQHTDFIFSIIAEETGFVGAFIVICLYSFVLFKGLQLSWHLSSSFGRYIMQGFVLLTTIQAIINIAVAVGLFPTKGIGLPFVSYGNSALLCSVAMLGLLWRIVKESS